MTPPPRPANEAERLATLAETGIAPSPPEAAYDDLARLASRACGTPGALVSFLLADTQWWKAKVGHEGEGTPRDVSFCAYAILDPHGVLEVPDATADPRFRDNPYVTGPAHIRFYAGAPIVLDGDRALGTVCVTDTTPRTLDDEARETLRALARQAAMMLETRRALAALQAQADAQTRQLAALEARHREMEAERVRRRAESVVDELTGLANLRAFGPRLEAELSRARRSHLPLSLVRLDVDRLAAHNEQCGVASGDDVLATIGHLLASAPRAHDLAFRTGGDGFSLLLPDTDGPGALVVAERLRARLAATAWAVRPVTVSMGVATFTGAGSADDFVAACDSALRDAAQQGGDRAVAFPGPLVPAPG